MRTALVVLLLAVAGCGGPNIEWPDVAEPSDALSYRSDLALANVTDTAATPVLLIPIPDGSGRNAIASQDGLIIAGNGTQYSIYLDISDLVGTCHFEQGLLGMAFSPEYDTDHSLYITYTDKPCHKKALVEERKGDLVLAHITAPPGASVLDPAGVEVIYRLSQPYRNHNGGHILFGPDGFLYMGIGDGGDGGDPHGHGQNRKNVYGSIIRIVPHATGYQIPGDNPYVGTNFKPELYLYGLRNPWRFDFDDATGDLWIADVGENKVEEITRVRPDQAGGNLGWSIYEGATQHKKGTVEDPIWPIMQYEHEGGHCSVTGGYFLRDTHYPNLEGAFLFGDFCSGTLWAFHANQTLETVMETGLQLTGFGIDAEGSIYLMHWGGAVRKLIVLGDEL